MTIGNGLKLHRRILIAFSFSSPHKCHAIFPVALYEKRNNKTFMKIKTTR